MQVGSRAGLPRKPRPIYSYFGLLILNHLFPLLISYLLHLSDHFSQYKKQRSGRDSNWKDTTFNWKQEHRINCVYTQLLTFKEVGWQFSLHVIVCTAVCTTRNRICCNPFIDPVGLSDVKTAGQQYNQKMLWGVLLIFSLALVKARKLNGNWVLLYNGIAAMVWWWNYHGTRGRWWFS